MELTLQWFWLVKSIAFGITIWVCYTAFFKKKFQSKIWNTIAGILLILVIIQPIKLDSHATTKDNTTKADKATEALKKTLPEKVEGLNLKEELKDKGITSEDIWKKEN